MFETSIIKEIQQRTGLEGRLKEGNKGIDDGCFFYVYKDKSKKSKAVKDGCASYNVTENYILVLCSDREIKSKNVLARMNLNIVDWWDDEKQIYKEETGQDLIKEDRYYLKIWFTYSCIIDEVCGDGCLFEKG